MASTQGFDQLNMVQRRSIPYRQYFADMDLTSKQKARRENLAFILEDAIAIWLVVMEQNIINGKVDEIRDKQRLMYMIYDEISDKGFFENEAEQDRYVSDFVEETYRSTVENRQKYPNDVVPKSNVSDDEIEEAIESTGEIPKDMTEPYWTSEDRAQFIAENEANTLYNGADYIDAKKQGKTHKIWKTYQDDRVRPTHIEVEGAKLPIDEYFYVGRAKMLYPKDVTSEFSTGAECPEEIVNCRCVAVYL